MLLREALAMTENEDEMANFRRDELMKAAQSRLDGNGPREAVHLQSARTNIPRVEFYSQAKQVYEAHGLTFKPVSHPFKPPGALIGKGSPTKKHVPLVWENMLGTVNARHRTEGERYFDFHYEAAHAHAEVGKHSDLRIAKSKESYQGWPRKGKVALWGIPPS